MISIFKFYFKKSIGTQFKNLNKKIKKRFLLLRIHILSCFMLIIEEQQYFIVGIMDTNLIEVIFFFSYICITDIFLATRFLVSWTIT